MSRPMLVKSFLLTAFAIGLNASLVNVTFARWATPQDAPIEIEQATHTIYVKKDGTYTKTNESMVKLLKEDAKADWAHYAIQYNADTTKIKILEAKTIVNGKSHSVNTSQIEDKPIASNPQGFDQTNQIIIAYPHLETNANTYLKYQEVNTKAEIDNFYAQVFTFGLGVYSKSAKVFITSEMPLYIEANDPEKLLNIKQSTKKGKNNTLYLTEITQIKPFIKAIVDEEKPIANLKQLPIVSISSMKTLSQYGDALAPSYEKVKQQPLPNLYKKISDIAKTKESNIEKINTITALLSENITYLADVRTIKGSFVPQPLQKVADTRLGDCKDFSMATSAILQAIGIPSKIAFVMRGEANLPFPNHLPGPGHLNHAMVKVELPEGPLWIDPTNFVSMAGHVFPDIADRKVIVLSVKGSTYEAIPPINPNKQRTVTSETWDMKDPTLLQVKGAFEFVDGAAMRWTGLKNRASEASIKHAVISSLGDKHGQLLDYQVTLPNLESRIVNDLTIGYQLNTKYSGLKTNAGVAIPLAFEVVNDFVTKKDTVSDIYIGTPRVIERNIIIENIAPAGKQSLDCNIESPWMNISRTVKYEKNKILVSQRLKVKQSWIKGESLESEQYKKLQLAIAQNFNNGIAIIFENKS